jgi:hypothetical protein
MKKIVILSAILIGLACSTYGQNGNSVPKFSVGGTLGATTSDQSGVYPVAGSFFLKYETPINTSDLSVAFILGYTYYISANGYSYYSDDYGTYSSGSIASFFPIQVGLKYYLSKGLFVEADGGVSFYLNSDYGSKVAPVITPGIGYTIPFGRSRCSLDLGLIYETRPASGSNFSQIAGRLAFNVGL